MRFGVGAGPFYVSTSGKGLGEAFAWLMVVGAIVAAAQAAVQYWYVTVPVALLIGVAAYYIVKEQRARRLEATRAWLAGPPPPLNYPGRVTENWLAGHVPYLHPGQVPMLMRELRSRGWSDQKLDDRVGRYLEQNPFLG
jgi:hypothetical protein